MGHSVEVQRSRRRGRARGPKGEFGGPRQTRRRIALLIFVVVVAFSGVAGWRLASIANDLRTARDLVLSADAHLEDGDLRSARSELESAEVSLLAANRRLTTSVELQIAGLVPGISQNLGALRWSVANAYKLAAGGRELLEMVDPFSGADGRLGVPLVAGAVPLEPLRETAAASMRVATSLPTPLDRPDEFLLIGPVADLQGDVYAETIERRQQLLGLGEGLSLLAELSGGNGQRRYLLAIANEAEMRGTGGMILSYGILESDNGDFSLRDFGPIDELFLAAPPATSAAAPLDGELARWSGLEPSRLWRNANLIPDFALVGPRLEAMFEAATGLPTDGVIQIDADGLAAILAGIGPVDVPGIGEVSAENVVDLTLNQFYTRFETETDQRREVLGEIAEVIFDELVGGDSETLRPLGEAVAVAAHQRHIMLYSAAPDAREPLEFFDASGAVPPPNVGDPWLLTVQNFGRDKLDYYLDTSVDAIGTRAATGAGTLAVDVTLTNNAPPGVRQPSYVFGSPDVRDQAVEPGTYVGVASMYVPDGATLDGVEGDGGPGTLVVEAGRPVVGVAVQVPAGESITYTLHFSLPALNPGSPIMTLIPSPRVRPTTWTVAVDVGGPDRVEWSGRLQQVVTLG